MNGDRYWKLKPEPPTPLDQICVCEQQHPVVLCYALTSNPIRCISCNKELSPERLEPTEEIVEAIASWRQFYSCFYLLWLDSGEFEEWAHQQLSDPYSSVNKRSYGMCQILCALRPCYYWYFQYKEANDFKSLSYCPKCGITLTRLFERLVCEDCQILINN